jgi:hypothetical protein
MRSATQAMQFYGRKSISSFDTRPAGGQTRPSVTLMTDLIDRASAEAPSHIGSLAVHRQSGLWFRSVRVRALEYNERRTVA